MKRLYTYVDIYIKESSWKDLALIKFCMCAVGVLIGLMIPKGQKKWSLMAAGAVFLLTYIPLMGKFLGGIFRRETKEERSE